MDRQVGALGEVLPQQPVGVLVRAALSWALRVAEVDRDVGRQGEPLVLGHLLAAVPGQRSTELVRQAPRLLDQRSDHRAAVAVRHLRQHDVARVPLGQALLFTAGGGDLDTRTFLVINANGTAGFQAAGDFVIELVSPVSPIDQVGKFI